MRLRNGRAICTIVGGVLAWVAYLRGQRASMGGVLACVAWLGWVACYYCYCYCYYWNTILKKKILNVYFWYKNEKNDPNRYEQWFKTRLEGQVLLYITWAGKVRIINISESQFRQICLDMCNFVSMPEYAWNITYLNKADF